MELSTQTKEYLSSLSKKTGKTEKEIIELAIFLLYQDDDKFIKSPFTGEMWLKEEVEGDEVVSFVDSEGNDFQWVRYPDTDTARKLIGERIKDLREKVGITQLQLAKKAGITRTNLSRIELGKYSAGMDVLTKIARGLGGKLDIILK